MLASVLSMSAGFVSAVASIDSGTETLNEATAHLKVSTSELYKTFPPFTSTFRHHKNDIGTRVRQTSALRRATSKLVLELPGVRAAMPRITSAEVALSIAFSVSASPIGSLANSTTTEIKRARARLNDMVSTSEYTNPQPPFSIPSLPVMSPDDTPLHIVNLYTSFLCPRATVVCCSLLPLPLCKRARSFCVMAFYSFPDTT